MEATIKLKVSEITFDLITKIKSMFNTHEHIELTFKSVEDFDLLKQETPEEYKKRIIEAIDDLEKGENTVSFSEQEFDEFTAKLTQS